MDLAFSKDDLAFREEVRRFIDENFDAEMRAKLAQSKNGYLDKDGQLKWQRALYKRGWAAPNWPVEYGGTGWTPSQKYIFESETAAAGTPLVSPMGLKMVAPVLMAFGSDAQKKKYLPPVLASEVWWCQGYSEPGSGSDLASLQMRCEDKGDHYLLNGSKIWTTHAQWADWMFNLVRTKQGAKPQEGISFILVDMKTPGIRVEPIVTLDVPVASQQEINQVFYDDVKVPKENLIGEENRGWTYAKFLLGHERTNIAGIGASKRELQRLKQRAASQPKGDASMLQDPVFATRIAQVDMELRALEITNMRVIFAEARQQAPGPEASMLKIRGTEILQCISELQVDLLGADALVQGGDVGEAARSTSAYLNLRKLSIFGGSNEIQRNIIAHMILGL